MLYNAQLTKFFVSVVKDGRITSEHITIYMALFQLWNLNKFINPISVTRKEVTELVKITQPSIYNRCMKELAAFGYIEYVQSFHPVLGSLVHLKGEPVNVEQ
ncbi:hypothetical protein [Foetidibacter luteolus]|uniref:hypothetical protein n=1 Tax=Foetidibacter luteolus TaxID=2608880 RepID=UPI00129AC1EC|nr:hypothetical protein [Foetidibacter luteolus]